MTDEETIALAETDGRLLLTEDKDFGELVFRWRWPVPGLVLVRIEPQWSALRSDRLLAAIEHYGEGLKDRYTVIEEARFRSRPLRTSAI